MKARIGTIAARIVNIGKGAGNGAGRIVAARTNGTSLRRER
jgi:hypothetical protein